MANSSSSSIKIQEISDINQPLIPNLPNDLSSLILSFIPFPFHGKLKSISKSWKKFYSSKTPFSLRANSSRLSHLLCIFPQDPSLSSPYLFDPTFLAWAPLPPMEANPHVYALSNFAALSIGPHVYVLGGSVFDTRAFPMDRPVATAAVVRFDLVEGRWDTCAPMGAPRGSLAAAMVGGGERIVVAGGGSRHPLFGAAGSRVGSAEVYDVEKDEWRPVAGLPGSRAGCVGFWVGGRRGEFWVMGGYGEAKTINGVLPVDEHYKDAVVLRLEEGRWREVGDMWEDGARPRLGKIAVVHDDDDEEKNLPAVFMLDGNHIFRYNMELNLWFKESVVPRKNHYGSTFGFVALRGELHVISLLEGVDFAAIRKSRHRRRGTALYMQIYNPKKMLWRSLLTRTPERCHLDLKTAVMCTIRL